MAIPLLQTKLYTPAPRSRLVPRPRLIERLNAGLSRKLTLVSAPAGYGKTTLVSEWLRTIDRPVAWISLDEGDNDPVRFLSYLVAALQQIDDQVGRPAQHLLETPQPPPVEPLLTELVNEVATRSLSFALVLDDYHTISKSAVHGVVTFLLEHQPSRVHVVIISRHDPPVPLSRLRGRGQVTEVRQRDLRFTLEETTTFLNQTMGLDLDSPNVAALDARTEGWITGLQMAAAALQSHVAGGETDSVSRFIESFSGRHHFILDYLTDEVLKRQPEPIYRFLLQTSILERMCGPLCDAVRFGATGLPDRPEAVATSSQQVLEHLRQENLFVVELDDERKWYRYHRLFAELLRARLQTRLSADSGDASDLHRRAATWYGQNALPAEAIHHALTIPDFDLAADVIEHTFLKTTAWSSLSVAVFQEWLNALPGDVVRARPRLRLYASRVLYLTGQRDEAQRILQELETSLGDDPSIPDGEELLALVTADRASYAAVRGDVQQAIDLAERASTHLPKDSPMVRTRVSSILGLAHFRAGNMPEATRAFSEAIAAAQAVKLGFVALPFICNLAEIQLVQGQLRRALQTCQEAMEMAVDSGAPASVAGFVGLELGKVLYEQNDLPAAEQYVSESLDQLGRSGTTDSFGIGHALLARIKQARGDDDGALTAIQRAIQIAQTFDIARVTTLIEAHRARVWLAQGKMDLAAGWAREYGQSGKAEYLREFEDLTLARVLLAQDKPSQALALLDALLIPAEAAGRMGTAIEALALRALALQALGDSDQALGALKHAITLAELEGHVRVFLDEGEPMARLLRDAASLGIARHYTKQLLAALESQGRPAVDMSALIEPLSERELQVLGLLAERLSNAEIAQRLVISLPSVKSHTRSIYGKLGVHNRKDAVARARALDILPH